ncbi:MAG: 2-hydroxyacyl-CoA dehydratase [Clostridia bacterium]|nr:2-hydroxyacyl-CoA dehydratase [Clostridia bacterium]
MSKELQDYTILVPDMCHIHFSLLKNLFAGFGYSLEVLTNQSRAVVDEGLMHVHNDTCYPALLVIGQMIDALKSGKYDLDKTALMITQTGGGCRASNYIHLLRKALQKAGYGQIPVFSINASGLEKGEAFKLSFQRIRKAFAVMTYGDMLMLLSNQTEPYESEGGATQQLVLDWIEHLDVELKANRGFSLPQVRNNLKTMAANFAALPLQKIRKIKVGIVGEIYVKYSSLGNNNLEKFLKEQGCEVMVPGLLGFIYYCVDNRLEDIRLYGGTWLKKFAITKIMNKLLCFEKAIMEAVKPYGQFTSPLPFYKMKALAKDIIGYGVKMGEGWLLTAEMLELTEHGYENIVCAQPFGCLPNHIVGRGMIRKIRSLYPGSNIVPIDYDPGATKVNQENRIKLMLALAKEVMEKKEPVEMPYCVPDIVHEQVV